MEILVKLNVGVDGYFINTAGEVFSNKSGELKMLKCPIAGPGYKMFHWWDGKRKARTVHRLVMETFVGPSNLVVNHKNGIKTDNRLENLEYVSPKQNSDHAWETGLVKARSGFVQTERQKQIASETQRGSKSHRAKLVEDDIRTIRKLCKVMTQKEVGSLYGVNKNTIQKIMSGLTWGHVED